MHKQNQTIDLLRFTAAFAVCIFHFNELIPLETNWYRTAAKLGWLGVPVFFVISGYCIELSIKNATAFSFITRRFFRIYPLYWTSLLIVLAVVLFQKLYTGYNSVTILPKNIAEVAGTIFLYIDPISKISSMSWVYWSLVCEVCFYLVIFFSLLFRGKFHITTVLIITILSIYFVFDKTANNLHINPSWYRPLKEWPAFALGLSIAKIHVKNNDHRPLNYILLICSITALFRQNSFNIETPVNYLSTTIFTATIIVLSNYKDIKPNIISNLGKYSYSTYLIHVPIGVYFINTIYQFPKTNIALNIMVDLFIYLILLFISILLYQRIEKPSIKLGKKIIAKFQI